MRSETSVAFFVLAIAGCSGATVDASHVAANGRTPDPLLASTYSGAPSAGELQGPVAPCRGGYAHPTGCCRGTPGHSTTCSGNIVAPFAPCPAGALGFPDSRLCCPLDGGSCLEATSSPTDASVAGSCNFPCGPTGYSPDVLSSPPLPACEGTGQGQDCIFCCTYSPRPERDN